MERLATECPDSQVLKNKGCPTNAHRDAIRQHGITPYLLQTFTLLPQQLELSF